MITSHGKGRRYKFQASTILLLMISSILLLLVLQFFWLRSSYENAFTNFRRETSTLLRSTVFDMRDSLLVQNIRPVKNGSELKDSIPGQLDSMHVRMLSRDTIIDRDGTREQMSNVQVFINSPAEEDSLPRYLAPLASTIQRFKDHRYFVFRMGSDTLSIHTLSSRYTRALNLSEMHVPFNIKRIDLPPPALQHRRIVLPDEPETTAEQIKPGSIFSDTINTDHVRVNPVHAYVAVFPGMRMNVLKAIAPQISFSALLTFITVSSFILMFRNIRAQQRLMDMKNSFISNVTHELKTPLATVSVALEALRNFHALDDPERTKEYLAIAQSEINRLALMTEKILKASAFEAQGSEFVPEAVNLEKIFDHVLSSMRLVFEKRNIKVNYTSCDGNSEFYGSELHITNVVFNLLDNAVKYGRENSNIDVVLNCNEGRLQFSIQDDGIGIAKEYHQKIFEKFFRVPSGDVHNTKGYGLGLNYVAEVIKSHHGRIDIESVPGKGSCFKVTLPRKHVKG